MPFRFLAALCLAIAQLSLTGNAQTLSSDCLAIAQGPARVQFATDFSGNAGGILPDVITMNRAHRSHYTPTPDPAIKNVLRGWNEDGTRLSTMSRSVTSISAM